MDIWRWTKLKITKLSRRQTQIIIITIGLLLFLITIVYSVKTDIKAVARQMDETLKYVKEQVKEEGEQAVKKYERKIERKAKT